MLINLPFVALPLVLLIWSIDCWLWLSVICVFCRGYPGERMQYLTDKLTPLISALPETVRRLIARFSPKQLSPKYYWIFTILAVIALRHLLIFILFYLGRPV